MQSGSYEVRSIDHPERTVVIHLEVVDRDLIYAYERQVNELKAQVDRQALLIQRLQHEAAAA